MLLPEIKKAIPVPEMVSIRQYAERKQEDKDKSLELSTKTNTRSDANLRVWCCIL